MIRDHHDRMEAIAALTERYRTGELGEATYSASLHIEGLRGEELRLTINEHQTAHRQSLPYLRGIVT